MWFWSTLGIAPTDDPRTIKRAYAARLKDTRPESDPTGYQALGEAYDAALAACRGEADSVSAVTSVQRSQEAGPGNDAGGSGELVGTTPETTRWDLETGWLESFRAAIGRTPPPSLDEWRAMLRRRELDVIDVVDELAPIVFEDVSRWLASLSKRQRKAQRAVVRAFAERFDWLSRELSLARFIELDDMNRVMSLLGEDRVAKRQHRTQSRGLRAWFSRPLRAYLGGFVVFVVLWIILGSLPRPQQTGPRELNDALRQGRFEEVVQRLGDGRHLAPGEEWMLASALRGLGLADSAEQHIDNAIAAGLDDGYAYWFRAGLRNARGDWAAARDDYVRAAARVAERPALLNSFAWLLAVCPDASIRDPERAIELAQRAVAPPNDGNGIYLDTLAAAYAARGRFDDAVTTQVRALDHLSETDRATYGDELTARLELYRRGETYLEPQPAKPSPQ